MNFRYVAGDGRLKTLNFIITSKAQLDRLLSRGERVDGSSLLPYIDAASSDLYVIPRYKTAYVNPFSPVPTVDILCSYYTSEGIPLPSSLENIVGKAGQVLKNATGLTLEAMGELEYYVLYDSQRFYQATAQRGYHESAPFSKWEGLRCEAMQLIAQAGGKPIDPCVLTHAFTRMVRQANLNGVRFHDLRHTFASLMLLRGAKPKVISEALGHSSVAFTMDVYSHIIEGMQSDAMALLDEVLPPGKNGTKNKINAKLTPTVDIMSRQN